METPTLKKRSGHVASALAVLYLLLPADVMAGDIRGTEHPFTSVNGVEERCVDIERLPGADYHHGDAEDTELYCSLDFSELVLCPKLWSTSPGTVVHQLSGTPSASVHRGI